MPPLIELENVTIRHGRTVALDQVSLRLVQSLALLSGGCPPGRRERVARE